VCHLGVTEEKRVQVIADDYCGCSRCLLEEIKGVMVLVTVTRLGYEAGTAEEGAEMEKHDEGVLFGACAHFSTGSEGKWREKEVKSTLRKTQTEQRQ
jgi:hypothetical protein